MSDELVGDAFGKVVQFPKRVIAKDHERLASYYDKPIDDPDLCKAARALYFWQYGNGDNFTSQLYSLIAKADPCNRAKLMQGFADEVIAFQMWQSSATPEVFFDAFGIKLKP